MPGIPKTREQQRVSPPSPRSQEGDGNGGASASRGLPLAQAHHGAARRRRRAPHDRDGRLDRTARAGKKTEKSTEVGKRIAAKAKDAGITKVVFDRGGYQYHGRVKAVADGAREGGLEF